MNVKTTVTTATQMQVVSILTAISNVFVRNNGSAMVPSAEVINIVSTTKPLIAPENFYWDNGR